MPFTKGHKINIGKLKQFCIHGHDTFECGREKDKTCKKCRAEWTKRWSEEKGHDYFRNNDWRREGFINSDGSQFTTVDRDNIYQIQQGKCKICGIHEMDCGKVLEVDHNHVTKVVRGLLCNPCNQRLGTYESFKDQAELYLKIEVNFNIRK